MLLSTEVITMSELESRVNELETENEQLKLEIQALRIAVVTISSVVNEAIGKTPGLMGNTIEESLIFDEDLDQDEERFNKMKSKLVHLLGKKEQ
ncbi:hypothetical protein ABF77_11120 [Enterobacter roggenkampii]|uniref:Uncharacterized protein n=2 Tax=Enterobacter roggenkampii TaxID=1812935 RepID=A0A837LFF2_9ENTR|nr:hypothetical protein ABF77_11120 [Enterobacter roggenkampii]